MREQGFQRGGHGYEKNHCKPNYTKSGIEGYSKENEQNVTNMTILSSVSMRLIFLSDEMHYDFYTLISYVIKYNFDIFYSINQCTF